MMLRRYNVKTKRYHPYAIPDDWYVTTFEVDMDKNINCARCGKEITFGEGYTSLQIHTKECGFGYTVCPSCHEDEVYEEKKFRRY